MVEPGWDFAELRTNGLNDGSMFEPCTAYTPAELRTFGLDATTASESSPHVDEDHVRGCAWDSFDTPRSFINQGIVNYGSHRDDVETIYQNDYSTEWTFYPNEFRNGRIVSTWFTSLDGRCTSEFEVEGAILTTEGADMRDEPPSMAQMCDWIRPFVDLALTKALPP